jgi:hypothetical protein
MTLRGVKHLVHLSCTLPRHWRPEGRWTPPPLAAFPDLWAMRAAAAGNQRTRRPGACQLWWPRCELPTVATWITHHVVAQEAVMRNAHGKVGVGLRWMRTGLVLVASVFGGCAVDEALPTRDAMFAIGLRKPNAPVYGQLDDQWMMRLDVDVRPGKAPVWIAGSVGWGIDSYDVDRRTCVLFWCSEESVTMESQIVDVSLGPRWWGWLGDGEARWFLGCGGAYAHAELDRYLGNFQKTGDRGDTFGGYVEAGLSGMVSWGHWGGYLRSYRGGSFDLHGADASADFDEIGLFVSFNW